MDFLNQSYRFFERESSLFNNDFIQTLEPQLFYVYVPYKDQSALPVFDTSTYAFNVNQSFTDYRFNGRDRVGDDNRLTAALATRFINQENGKEVFMARIGQIHYFDVRKVQLPSIATETGSRSNIIAELKFQPNNWNLSSQVEWDPELKETVTSSSQLGYNYKKFNFNLAHRVQRNTLETRELKIGINYESCCWGLKLSTKERYISTTQTDRGVYLELILKGLGGFSIQQ